MIDLLVTGDREWKDYDLIFKTIQSLHVKKVVDVVIEGEARGADKLARCVAETLFIPFYAFPAAWTIHGLSAGPKRNQKMLDQGRPNLVYAFHDHLENSKGTKDMVTRAIRADVETYLISHEGCKCLHYGKSFSLYER